MRALRFAVYALVGIAITNAGMAAGLLCGAGVERLYAALIAEQPGDDLVVVMGVLGLLVGAGFAALALFDLIERDRARREVSRG